MAIHTNREMGQQSGLRLKSVAREAKLDEGDIVDVSVRTGRSWFG
jgi:hypothetical protein